ncbi:MAG: DNA helicase RecQ [Halothiobacillus sp.]
MNQTPAAALQILQSVFGYHAFRDPQGEVIDTLMAGRDALVIMPTGGGKSLCYQVPALALPGTAIVVSPLIALMQDQVAALRQAGVAAAFLNSTQTAEQARAVQAQVRAGTIKLLYVAPERLLLPATQSLLQAVRISLVAIDEAHCVSQWGHDFRPEYIRLGELALLFPGVPRMALTATADETTRTEIIHRLALNDPCRFISGFDRPNIYYAIEQSHGSIGAREQLLRFIQGSHAGDAGIVYCLSRKKVEEIAEWLSAQGLTALPYHAGLPAALRERTLRRFLDEDAVIVVATIAFGMGIDKPDVRFVAHLNLPKSIEAYYQETGRAGRDGGPADAWMRFGLGDVIMLRQMMSESMADEAIKRIEQHKLDAMLGFTESTQCRRQTLLGYFGEERAEPCGHCDNCINPPHTWDATIPAQQALSCVHRTGQRFGVSYLIDVLRGKVDTRIRQLGHDQLGLFGLGASLSITTWRGIYRQLIARGYLLVQGEHGALALAESCRPLLQGRHTLWLRTEPTAKDRPVRPARSRVQFAHPDDQALWEALRAWRKNLASQHGVPPFTIFHDATLLDLIDARPRSLAELAQISGIGAHKRDAYGVAVLAVLAPFTHSAQGQNQPGHRQDRQSEHIKKTPVPTARSETVEQTHILFKSGMHIDAIVQHRGLTPTTVYTHLAELITQGALTLREVVELPEAEIARIQTLMHAQTEPGTKPLFEALGGQYSYDVLRCFQAARHLKTPSKGE